MKVTLDLAKLVEEGRLTPAEAERLKGLAAEGTGSAAINLLIGFGVVAVALGVLGLAPQPTVAAVLGAMVGAAGLGLLVTGAGPWALLANICLLAGSLMLGAGVAMMTEGSPAALLAVAAIFAAGGIAARSGLLVALAVLAISAAVGARTGYMHAAYMLGIRQPLVTVVLFSALAILAYQASKRLRADFARLAVIAARTSLLLVNFGFWIGSLWGDRLTFLVERQPGRYGAVLPSWTFSIAWAVAILGAGAWASRANRPWVLNLAAVFGAIHFYTQWFEKLGPNPFSILVAGLVTLALALAIWRYNRGRTIPA